jgi:hypothetical protein
MAKGAVAALVGMMPKGGGSKGAYDEEAPEDEGMEKFITLAQEAFPEEDMTEDRVMALKEFVKACYEREAE